MIWGAINATFEAAAVAAFGRKKEYYESKFQNNKIQISMDGLGFS